MSNSDVFSYLLSLFWLIQERIQQPKCLLSKDFYNVSMLLKCKKSDLFAVAPQKIYSSSKGHSKYKTSVLLKSQRS